MRDPCCTPTPRFVLQCLSRELGKEKQHTTRQSVPERHDAGRWTFRGQQGHHSDADHAGELSPVSQRYMEGQVA